MYIYNITTNVDESIHDAWFKWMEETHILNVLAAGKFSKALMTQVLVREEMGGFTYSVQYTIESKEKLEKYLLEKEQELQNEGFKLFGDKHGSFSTVMKIVDEFKQ
ncbi:MAG: DUF4286 family protein [Flavobacteriaceae bacterium]|nr:DUF4286 family protein [Flavobacteriaceae bacterium]